METTAPHRPKFVRFALMLGIVVILNIFFSVIVALAYPAPQYNDYCPIQPVITPTAIIDTTTCTTQYQAANDQHALYAFASMIILGLIALVAGILPIGSSIVSSGLSYGGVLAFIIASIQYWGTAGNWLRLAIAATGLIALLYIGWKRFRD